MVIYDIILMMINVYLMFVEVIITISLILSFLQILIAAIASMAPSISGVRMDSAVEFMLQKASSIFVSIVMIVLILTIAPGLVLFMLIQTGVLLPGQL